MSLLTNRLKKFPLQHWALVTLVTVILTSWLFIITALPPNLSPKVANGKYVNSEGAALILRDGEISAGNGSLGYLIETDKTGAYILLDGRLVAKDGGIFNLEPRPDSMKARLDRRRSPSTIDFFIWPLTPGNPNLVRFERQSD